MSLELIIGPSGSGKTFSMREELLRRSAAELEVNYLVLVPEQFNMQTQRDIVLASKNQGIMNIDVLSFNRLCHRIFDEAGGNRKVVLDDCAKTMILRKIAGVIEDKLTVMAGKLDKAGYINEVKSIISEFMQYNIGSEEIACMIENNQGRSNLTSKLADIKLIYDEFVKYLGDRYITTEELLDAATDIADHAKVLENAEIYLDGYTGFTPVQRRFLKVLMSRCRRVVVTVTLGNEEIVADSFMSRKVSDEELFSLSRTTIQKLMQDAAEVGATVEAPVLLNAAVPYRLRGSERLAMLERRLFRADAADEKPVGDADAITIFNADTLRDEAYAVCRRIHELVRNDGYRYREICILTGMMEEYEGVLRQAMRDYDIPCFMDMRRNVLMNPLSELVRSVLYMIEKNYDYESVMRYMRCDISGFAPSETDAFDVYMVAAGVKRGSQLHKSFNRKVKGFDDKKLQEVENIRLRLEDMIKPLRECFGPKKKVKCAAMLRCLYEYICARNAFGEMQQRAELLKEKGEHEREGEYRSIYEKLIELFDGIMDFLGEEKLSVRELAEIIDAGFSEQSVGILPPGVDEVIIGDIKRSRLSDLKVLFLMGVNDGVIPADMHKRGILSELDREILKNQKLGTKELELAPDTRQQAFIQKFYLYMYLTKASEKLFLSYSRQAADGSACDRSYLIDELCQMFPDIKVEKYDINNSSVLTVREGIDNLTTKITHGIYDKELFEGVIGEEKYREYARGLLDHAFRVYTDTPIQKAVASALYGMKITGSVTRLEKFAQCAYAHFLKYGLKLRERSEFSFENRDLGTIYHSCLQEYGKVLGASEYSWLNVPEDTAVLFMRTAVDRVLKGESEGALYENYRSSYTENRIRRIMERTIRTLTYQVKKGDFEPVGYEVAFGKSSEAGEIYYDLGEATMSFYGVIDRLDTFTDGDKTYIRIVDYKSGSQSLDYVLVYEGISLQLPMYAGAGVRYIKNTGKNNEVINAGVFYYHIDDPVIKRNDEAEDEAYIEKEIIKALSMKGVVSDDTDIIRHMDHDISGKSDIIPAGIKKDGGLTSGSKVLPEGDMDKLMRFAYDKVEELGRRIMEGEISASPYKKGSGDQGKSACKYCSYGSICGFDEHAEGYAFRDLSDITDAQALEMILSDEKQAEGDEETLKDQNGGMAE